MSFFDSPFTAQTKNERIEGVGQYVFPSGNIYIGEFQDGKFHGQGTIFFKVGGGKYEATWDQGKCVKGVYTFNDGLVYGAEGEDGWDYCTKGDRRFYHERVDGIPSGIFILI